MPDLVLPLVSDMERLQEADKRCRSGPALHSSSQWILRKASQTSPTGCRFYLQMGRLCSLVTRLCTEVFASEALPTRQRQLQLRTQQQQFSLAVNFGSGGLLSLLM